MPISNFVGLIPMPGPTELIIILVIVLLVFGPKRLTGAGKALGESLREFKKSVNDKDEKETKEVVESKPADKVEV
ncbi:MAG: twin-arginine translocase TatA/TatE family subunit [Candidatus Aquicultorales bacterium]